MSEVSLEELVARYLSAVEAEEEARFMQSAVAWTARQAGGRAALAHIAQTAQRKAHKLAVQAEVFDWVRLREGRLVLTWLHLNILSSASDALFRKAGLGPIDNDPAIEEAWGVMESWADRAVDGEWSPAQLRREVAAFLGAGPDDPATVIKKAESSSEKLRKVVDEAALAGVLPQVAERVESANRYAQERLKSAEDKP